MRLTGTLIGARGLETIKSLPRELRDLHDCARVADDAIPLLAAMQTLQSVDLTGTMVNRRRACEPAASQAGLPDPHGALESEPGAPGCGALAYASISVSFRLKVGNVPSPTPAPRLQA